MAYFHDFNIIGSPAECDCSSGAETFAAAVDGDKEVVATALYGQGDGDVIVQDDGADIKAVRGDG